MRSRFLSWTGWLYVLLCIAFLNWCFLPVGDDWLYREESWGHILSATCREYCVHNGRFLACLLTRAFSLAPVWVVDLANTAAFLALMWLMTLLAFGRNIRKALRMPELPLLLWILLVGLAPNFGDVFLWHCGSANYLWTSLLLLCFLFLFLHGADIWGTGTPGRTPRGRRLILLSLLALIAGSCNENTGIAFFLTACYLTWSMVRKGVSIRPFILLLALCFAGWSALILAPGNYVRLAHLRAEPLYMNKGLVALALQMLEVHLRAIPLYALLFFVVRRRKRTVSCDRSGSRVFWVIIATGLMCQLAFLASPATPPLRAQQITFTMIGIAAVRILLPALRQTRRPMLWRFVLVVAALLPLLGFPKAYRQRVWVSHAIQLMKEAKGTGKELVLPYWYFKKDRLFGSLREYVPSERSDDGIAAHFGLTGIRQSDKRCTYSLCRDGWSLHGTSYDKPGYVTRTEWKLTLAPRQAEQVPLYLHIAYPDTWKMRLSPRKLASMFFPCTDTYRTWSQLQRDGYMGASLKVGEPLVWERGKPYSKKPECPALWVGVSDSASPGLETLLYRIEAQKEP